MAREILTAGSAVMAASLALSLAGQSFAQTPSSPAEQAAATYIAASQMQALNQNCKLLDEVDTKSLAMVVSDAASGIAPDQLLKAELQKNGAVAQVKGHPCSGPQADAAKARIRSELAPIGHLWAARARAFADLQAKTYPFLSAVKGSGLPGSASNIRTAADTLDKNFPANSPHWRDRANAELDAAARVACARLGGKSCPAPPAGSNADLALGFLGKVADYGATLNALVTRVMASQAPRPAPPAPKPVETLTEPTNPRDYVRFAGISDVSFGLKKCVLGEAVAYVPASQVPATLAKGTSIKAPVYKFGGKTKLGEVTLLKDIGAQWIVMAISPEAQSHVSGVKANPCGY